jgi:hypothetical protein
MHLEYSVGIPAKTKSTKDGEEANRDEEELLTNNPKYLTEKYEGFFFLFRVFFHCGWKIIQSLLHSMGKLKK